ncbi:MAG: ABC transporter substrate-binding protein [Breznakiellaceae bacterium]
MKSGNKWYGPFLSLFVLKILLGSVLIVSACSAPKVSVALMTKLEAGSIIGVSEIGAVRLYEKQHPKSRLVVYPFDDGWDPERTITAYKHIREQKISFLITSHTSTCALAIAPSINQEKVLAIITGATTNELSSKDDNIFRVVPDVNQEQLSLVRIALENNPKKMLIIRDMANPAYVVPALDIFSKALHAADPAIFLLVHDIDTRKFSIDSLEPLFKGTSYDFLYLLIGGYKNIAGNIAQLSYQFHPETPILFTPWMNNVDLIMGAGPAIQRFIIPSLYPSRTENVVVETYMRTIEENYGVSPTILSFNVYVALELLEQAVESGATTPEAVKKWLLTQGPHKTMFGSITFDRYGEVIDRPYYVIKDIRREFK